MAKGKYYTPEFKEQAVRMVVESTLIRELERLTGKTVTLQPGPRQQPAA